MIKLYKIFILFITISSINLIAEPSKKVSKKNLSIDKTKLSFEDLLVSGKYHFSDEAVATIEDDKILDALLQIRKDFKDRVERSVDSY